eukprot:4735382-Pleurochrysis_carterae.AAC.7
MLHGRSIGLSNSIPPVSQSCAEFQDLLCVMHVSFASLIGPSLPLRIYMPLLYILGIDLHSSVCFCPSIRLRTPSIGGRAFPCCGLWRSSPTYPSSTRLRMKWSADDDKASLAAAQSALAEVLAEVKGVNGFKSVQRIVCGGCLDFKASYDSTSRVRFVLLSAHPYGFQLRNYGCVQVITALDAAQFSAWEEAKFAPEEKFLTNVKGIKGISQVETQTYTLAQM